MTYSGHTVSSRERILAALEHRQSDRIPMIETLFWPATIERWKHEGLPDDVDIYNYFGLDRLVHVFGIFDCTLQVPEKIIEETALHIVKVNRYGSTMKESKIPFEPEVMLKPGIVTELDWEKVKPRLIASKERLNLGNWVEQSRKLRAEGAFVTVETIEPLWFALYNTMGFEHGLFMMADKPDLLEDMIATYTDFSLEMLEMCFDAGFEADALFFYSDLCYKNGLLFSPQSFRELAAPHLKKFGDFCRKHGMKFLWHSDGNVAKLIPLLKEIGVDAIHPLEARAGNDVVQYKKEFGNEICLIGNIDADKIATGDEAVIEREVAEKIPTAKKNGGYIYHIDHSVPPTISLKSYRFLLDSVRKHGGFDL